MIDFNLVPLMPEIFLAITAMGLLIVGAFQGNCTLRVISWFGVGALCLALFMLTRIDWHLGAVLNNMFELDTFSAIVKVFIIIGLVASLALSVRYLFDENIVRFEFPILILLAGVGMLLMVSATHFLSLYVALELQSLSLYVLAAFRRTGLRSSEAGVKYFTLGALSSGMLLFGISLIYGAVGGLAFDDVAMVAAAGDVSPLLIVGMVFVISALAFKVSAAPFHMWTPDVYQGAPSAVTAFFAIVPKLAAMALLIKLLMGPFYAMALQWGQVLYALALLSTVVGAFAALVQDNVKRLMAYSSIGNMGYAMIGLVAASPAGVSATLLYLVLYMFMTAGAFAIILSMRRGDLQVLNISDFAGLSQTRPFLAYGFAIILFSMSGIPPMAGFFGKLVVFEAAMEAELYVLGTIGVVSSVIAAFYYLRLIKVMFFDPPEDAINDDTPFARYVVLGVSLAMVTFFIFKPAGLMDLMDSAAQSLFIS
ncbi:MAG: NADH-quinone oxidoreductase subunit NuoN [Alphaproteobacteria bacterium]|nr:NADH-quinone oxidoreductase subunit NuoN [Alphaproteobacteria bacterium]HCQ71580.1 NADH-quinone oxidoreductase subunit NuoN [Rhodospirillaceae bacterium]|tara:strand:- start:1989 stop:3428 length:1440 start_codon:yes stop_codon:yes gene_type:complete